MCFSSVDKAMLSSTARVSWLGSWTREPHIRKCQIFIPADLILSRESARGCATQFESYQTRLLYLGPTVGNHTKGADKIVSYCVNQNLTLDHENAHLCEDKLHASPFVLNFIRQLRYACYDVLNRITFSHSVSTFIFLHSRSDFNLNFYWPARMKTQHFFFDFDYGNTLAERNCYILL